MRSGLRCGDGGRTVDAPSVRSIKGAQPSITLTDQDKLTLRTAAYGAVTLLAAADARPTRRRLRPSPCELSVWGP